MIRDTDLLLGSDSKRSPLRVRIPSNPYANDTGSTPSKSDAHSDSASVSEGIHRKYTLVVTTVLLLLLLTLLYCQTGGGPSEQYSPAVHTSAPLHNTNVEPTGQDMAIREQSKVSSEDALAATSRYSNQEQAPLASVSNAESDNTLPGAQGTTKLSAPLESSKAVVVAQHREDIAWLKELPVDINQYVYQAENDTAEYSVRVNQGETAAYLQYIVEHYDDLPDVVAFVHGHQDAPHMPDKLVLLKNLRWTAFGYANLRYTNVTFDLWGRWTGDWLCPQHPLDPPPSDEIIWDALRVNQSQLFADVWHELFEGPIGPVPQYVHSPCCAEFVVSKERIHARPLLFYQSCLTWLEATSSERYWAGRIFEYVWHIIFGKPSLYYAPDRCELLYC
ncbi:hypothetical protein MMC14_009645 [Varicellaria rhodocarpa]|nr:hypothetical protein [Varicellaria rhodocarpa]